MEDFCGESKYALVDQGDAIGSVQNMEKPKMKFRVFF
jgi:hypothetical protein